MADILHIADAVVTEDCLRRRHQGETAVQVGRAAVITPTGYDYLRAHRLRLTRGDGTSGAAAAPAGAAPSARHASQVREVRPPTADGQSIRPEGRFEHKDRPFGCKTDDFGSGFAAASGGRGTAPAAAGLTEAELEALVQRLTDEIMERLNGR
ncbi:MAG: hypothetical protein ABIL09_13135 [Gemmatimonadota bacterium]